MLPHYNAEDNHLYLSMKSDEIAPPAKREACLKYVEVWKSKNIVLLSSDKTFGCRPLTFGRHTL